MKLKSLPSRLFGRRSASPSSDTQNVQAAKYERQVDCEDRPESLDRSGCDDNQQVAGGTKKKEKCHREIHFSFVTERYEQLMDEAQAKAKEEKKKMKKEKYKKVKKNAGKAMRATWKCLMLGLYNFALGYSTPITVAATFVPEFYPGRNRT